MHHLVMIVVVEFFFFFLLSAVLFCSHHLLWPDSLSHNLWSCIYLPICVTFLHANTLIDFTLICSCSSKLSSSIANFKLVISVHSGERFELSSVPKFFSSIFSYVTRDSSLCLAIPLSDYSFCTEVPVPWDSHSRVIDLDKGWSLCCQRSWLTTHSLEKCIMKFMWLMRTSRISKMLCLCHVSQVPVHFLYFYLEKSLIFILLSLKSWSVVLRGSAANHIIYCCLLFVSYSVFCTKLFVWISVSWMWFLLLDIHHVAGSSNQKSSIHDIEENAR